MSAITASADSGDLIEVQSYTVDMTVRTDRRVEVVEHIRVKFLDFGRTMFYRSLPTDGCKYENITAKCAGNDEFYYNVVMDYDTLEFIEVNCVGGADMGNVWTYEISYTMLQGVKSENGMTIDVVGFGWSVPLHDVTASVHFPVAIQESDAKVYVGGYGESKEYDYELLDGGKTLTVRAERLELVYNDYYEESMAKGITVDFELGAGVLDGYADTRMFTEDIGALLLAACACIAVGVVIFATRPKREIVTVVSVKPPRDMDPMLMGKILDGTVDNEDVTSMIYYFAHKGYLKIDLTDEDDPLLIRVVERLPDDVPAYEKTLFKGLFEEGSLDTETGFWTVRVSQLVMKFYEAVQSAKAQVRSPKPMYEKKSVFLFVLGGLLGGVFAFLATFLMGRKLGGGFFCPFGGGFFVPIAIILLLGWVREKYRYKWKPSKRRGMFIAQVAIAAVCALIFTAFFAECLMTEWESAALCLGAFLPAFFTQGVLVRTEKYLETLGEILGFKEFIIVTEEDKIEFMLAENPELYYEVLPYAQVLGVTDEWEKKFAKITLQPPTWYEGNISVFDYLILHRCMTGAMMRSMTKAAQQARGGGHVGRSGGGGGFGGFGGGGFGGGGGGAR